MNAGPDGQPPRPTRHHWTWWLASVAIPLLAIAATVVVALLSSDDDGDSDGAAPSSPPTTSERDNATSSAGSPAPTASSSSTSNDIQYTGTVRISEDGLFLDENPPKVEPDAALYDVRLGLVEPPRISADIGDSDLAKWTGREMPTRQDCSDLIDTQGVETVEVEKGTVVCVRTSEERIAVLTITSTSNDFNTGELAQATVWSATSDS